MIRVIGFVAVLGLMSVVAQPYQNTSLRQLDGSSSYIKVTGYFETDKTFTSRIDGTLQLGNESLPVRGSTFDWLPHNESWVVVWGELKSEQGKPYLEFHNGHPLTEPKAPRPVPDALLESTGNERANVWLSVSISGAKPNTFYQGISENRKAFVLDGYKGDLGIQCLSAVGARIRGRRALTDIRTCGSRKD